MTCYAVTIRYWAGARAAAGLDSETLQADSVSAALAQAQQRHGAELARILAVSSILVDGVTQRSEGLNAALRAPVEVEVLPPFAGG